MKQRLKTDGGNLENEAGSHRNLVLESQTPDANNIEEGQVNGLLEILDSRPDVQDIIRRGMSMDFADDNAKILYIGHLIDQALTRPDVLALYYANSHSGRAVSSVHKTKKTKTTSSSRSKSSSTNSETETETETETESNTKKKGRKRSRKKAEAEAEAEAPAAVLLLLPNHHAGNAADDEMMATTTTTTKSRKRRKTNNSRRRSSRSSSSSSTGIRSGNACITDASSHAIHMDIQRLPPMLDMDDSTVMIGHHNHCTADVRLRPLPNNNSVMANANGTPPPPPPHHHHHHSSDIDTVQSHAIHRNSNSNSNSKLNSNSCSSSSSSSSSMSSESKSEQSVLFRENNNRNNGNHHSSNGGVKSEENNDMMDVGSSLSSRQQTINGVGIGIGTGAAVVAVDVDLYLHSLMNHGQMERENDANAPNLNVDALLNNDQNAVENSESKSKASTPFHGTHGMGMDMDMDTDTGAPHVSTLHGSHLSLPVLQSDSDGTKNAIMDRHDSSRVGVINVENGDINHHTAEVFPNNVQKLKHGISMNLPSLSSEGS